MLSFTYDSYGRRLTKRVEREAPGDEPQVLSQTRYVWDGDVILHEITARAAAGGDPVTHVRTFSYADDDWEPIAQCDATPDQLAQATWLTFFNDGIGSPIRLLAPDTTHAPASLVNSELEPPPVTRAITPRQDVRACRKARDVA